MTTWRCVICGCDFDQAQAKRRRRREPFIRSIVVQTCSRACEEQRQSARVKVRRERRALRKRRVTTVHTKRRSFSKVRRRRRVIRPEGYWLRRYRRLRVPREQAWRCRHCGCSFAQAQAKRRRRAEREIRSLLAKTCSARCRTTYRTRIIRRWEREHPEAAREHRRRAYLKRRWKLYSNQHQDAQPYPDERRRRGGNLRSG